MDEQVKRIYDLNKSKVDLRVQHFSAEFYKSETMLPKVVDLRHLQSPIKDQKQLGYCFSFAAVAMREYIEIKNKQTFTPLSELYLGYKTKLREGSAGIDNGGSITDVMWALNNYGTCPENMDPYNPALFTIPTNKIEDMAAQKYKLNSYSKIHNLIELKTALAEGNCVEIGIKVFESFEHQSTIQTGKVPYPNKDKEQCLGGHAVLACCYNDITEEVIIKNSWGLGVGINGTGYFSIPYKFMNDPDLVIDMYAGK